METPTVEIMGNEAYPPECDDDIYFMLYGTTKEIIDQMAKIDNEARFDRAMNGV